MKSTLNVLNFQFRNCNRCHITFCDKTRNKCSPKKHGCGLKFNRFFCSACHFSRQLIFCGFQHEREKLHNTMTLTHHSFEWKRVGCHNDGTRSKAISRRNSFKVLLFRNISANFTSFELYNLVEKLRDKQKLAENFVLLVRCDTHDFQSQTPKWAGAVLIAPDRLKTKHHFFPRERTFFIRACATITGDAREKKSFPCDCKNCSGHENENSYNAFANVFHECSYVKNANFVHNKLIFPQLSLIGTRTSRCTVKEERVGSALGFTCQSSSPAKCIAKCRLNLRASWLISTIFAAPFFQLGFSCASIRC